MLRKRYNIIFCTLLIAGCATVAVTGRSQLSLISDGELIKAADQNYLSLRDAARSKGAIALPTDSPQARATIETINRVANKIIDASGMRLMRNWEINVIKSDVPNAMVLPNGKIFVFSGIVPVAKSEAGLAAIIGHEVAHVAARHAAERISQVMLADTTLQLASAIAEVKSKRNQPAIAAALGLGLQYGVLMPFSRTHESEADRIGQIYMAKAGYDPSEASGVWERMKSSSGKSKFEFFSTHPSHDTRLTQLNEWLPQARLFYLDQNKALPKSINEIEQAAEKRKIEIAYPVALRPDIKEDYWYEVKNTQNGEIKRITYEKLKDCDFGKCISVTSGKIRKDITSDYAIIKMYEEDGSWLKPSIPIRPIRFPLIVGDTWDDTVTLETSNGNKGKGTIKTRVISYEPIEVPAGNFMAYKTESSAGGRLFFQGWYVPETRGFVKSINTDKSGIKNETLLVNYQKSDDPSGEISRSTKSKL